MVSLSKIFAGGKSTQVNSAYAGNFQGLANDLTAEGYKITDIGGYNYRNIAGTNRLSKHSFGEALDINPTSNPVTYGGTDAMQTDIPNASSLAQKWGLKWGGDFSGSKRDPMHFEVTDSTTPMSNDSSAATAEPSQYVSIDKNYQLTGGATGAGDMTGIDSNGNQSSDAGALTMGSDWKELVLADANGDGQVTQAELAAYNAAQSGTKTIAGVKAAGKGDPSSVPEAIVTAGNQQALTQADALKAIAAGAAASSQATNATSTGLVGQALSWAGGRFLQLFVFVLALIFIGIGLYIFVPKSELGIPTG